MRRNILTSTKTLFIFFVILLFTGDLSAQDFLIKSLRVYSSADQTSFPLIDNTDGGEGQITIEFDLQSSYMPYLNIVFKFCDSNWQPYDNAFLANPMYDTERNIMFDRVPSNIQGASYHYRGEFPNNNVQFPFSGKWKFFIVDSQNKNLVYASGKFYVVKPSVQLNFSVDKEGLQGDISQASILQRSISISSGFTLPDTLFAANVLKVEIVQNRKIDYPIVIDRLLFNHDRYYEWNAANKFTFTARNIRPGNRYRETDLRNYSKYNTPTVEAKLGEFETSSLFTRRAYDIHGGTILEDFKNTRADYMNVVFRLRAPEDVKDPIYLVGSFTDWKVLPDFEMYDDNGMMNLTIPLKRGVYDYA